MSKLLSVREVADMVGVSAATVRSLVKKQEFPPPVTLGASQRWSLEEIEEFLERKRGANEVPHQ